MSKSFASFSERLRLQYFQAQTTHRSDDRAVCPHCKKMVVVPDLYGLANIGGWFLLPDDAVQHPTVVCSACFQTIGQQGIVSRATALAQARLHDVLAKHRLSSPDEVPRPPALVSFTTPVKLLRRLAAPHERLAEMTAKLTAQTESMLNRRRGLRPE